MTPEIHCPNCGHQWSLPSAMAETTPSAVENIEPGSMSHKVGMARAPDVEPIEFEPLGEELVSFTATAPTVHVVLKLTDQQLRDVLYAASSIGASTLYISVLVFISLAFQGFFVVLGTLAFLGSSGNVGFAKVGWLIAIYIVALTTLASAMLLGNYGSSLREFVRAKEPESLIVSLQSGSRFWLWTAIVMTFALAVGAMSFFALISDHN
jgi:hypothetical protein